MMSGSMSLPIMRLPSRPGRNFWRCGTITLDIGRGTRTERHGKPNEPAGVGVRGGGGGGAVLALALAKQGISTIVLDQAVGPPKGLRGEILQPNGQQVLDRLGV